MLDKMDIKIIQELQVEGREPYVDLASKLGVAEGTIRKRMKDLTNKELIKIVALPNLRKLGFNFISIMGLQVKMEELRNIANALARNEHICYLAFVTGRYDLMAFVIARTSEELSQFIEKEVSAIPSILRTETFINLDIIKGTWPLIDTKELISNLVPLDPDSLCK